MNGIDVNKITIKVTEILKGDDSFMEILELKDILLLLKKKEEYLESIRNKTLKKFSEKVLEFEENLDNELIKLLSLIKYKCEDLELSFICGNENISIKFENNFESLIKAKESMKNGVFDLNKYPIGEYESIFNNFERVKLDDNLKFEFNGHTGKSIERIIKDILYKKLDTDIRNKLNKRQLYKFVHWKLNRQKGLKNFMD